MQRLSELEELVGTATKTKTVALRCGLGFFQLRHAFADGREIVIKVLHQRRGPSWAANLNELKNTECVSASLVHQTAALQQSGLQGGSSLTRCAVRKFM